MKVLIDDREYVPREEVPADADVYDQALALPPAGDDAGEDVTSIRLYLRELLLKVWFEGEGFDGKRQFGNSGWDWDVLVPLVEAGFIKGKVRRDPEDGSFVDMTIKNEADANDFVGDLIRHAMKAKP